MSAERADTGAAPSTSGTRQRQRKSGKGASAAVVALVAVVLLALIAGGFLLVANSSGDPFGGSVDTAGYQAVILSNDKVYFGKIRKGDGDFYELSNVYFIREQQSSPDAAPQRQVLPLNAELQAPENRMLIDKDKVVIIENLDKASPVLKTIQQLEEQTKNGG